MDGGKDKSQSEEHGGNKVEAPPLYRLQGPTPSAGGFDDVFLCWGQCLRGGEAERDAGWSVGTGGGNAAGSQLGGTRANGGVRWEPSRGNGNGKGEVR